MEKSKPVQVYEIAEVLRFVLLNMDKDLAYGQKKKPLGKARQLLLRELMLATDESTLNQGRSERDFRSRPGSLNSQ